MAAICPQAASAPTHNDGASWWLERQRWSTDVVRFRAGEGGGTAAVQQFVSLVIISTLRYRLVTRDSVKSHVAFSVGAAQVIDEVPDVPVSGCPRPNMSKRMVNLNGSPDSRLGSAALHFVSMPPERFDWSDRRAPQAAPPQAGLAPAGLAQAAPPPSGAAAPGVTVRPDLVVRRRAADRRRRVGF